MCDWCTALITELGVRRQFGAARPTQQRGCCQCTATVPRAVHVSIVSPLVSDVRHIAEPSPTRSFEILISVVYVKTVSQDYRVWHSVEEIGDVVCDLVADRAHAFDAVDPGLATEGYHHAHDLTRTVSNDWARRSPAGLSPPWAFS